MSVIFECDGCDQQSKDHRKVKRIEIDIKSDRGQGSKEYHLCEQCETYLRNQANPQHWPRAARMAS